MNRMTLERLLAYDAWGNRASLDSVRAVAAPPERAVALLGHLGGAGRLWLERLRGAPQTMAVWPALSLEECSRVFDENRDAWSSYLAGVDERDLGQTIAYMNSKGGRFKNTVLDVLLHVTHHGAYHRGQIALLLRQNGAEPAYTDFIHAVRTGRVDR